MFHITCIDRFQDRTLDILPARIEQTIEAARYSLDRLCQLRDNWDRSDSKTSLQDELSAELAIPHAYIRQLQDFLVIARTSPYCLAAWKAELRELQRRCANLSGFWYFPE